MRDSCHTKCGRMRGMVVCEGGRSSGVLLYQYNHCCAVLSCAATRDRRISCCEPEKWGVYRMIVSSIQWEACQRTHFRGRGQIIRILPAS